MLAIELDGEFRVVQQELHRALVQDIIGPFHVGALHVEFATELGRLEIDVIETEEFGQLLEQVLRSNLKWLQRQAASKNDGRECMRRSILPMPGDIAVVERFQRPAVPWSGCDVVGGAAVAATKAVEFGITVIVCVIGSRREREAGVCCSGCDLLLAFGAEPQSDDDQCGDK